MPQTKNEEQVLGQTTPLRARYDELFGPPTDEDRDAPSYWVWLERELEQAEAEREALVRFVIATINSVYPEDYKAWEDAVSKEWQALPDELQEKIKGG